MTFEASGSVTFEIENLDGIGDDLAAEAEQSFGSVTMGGGGGGGQRRVRSLVQANRETASELGEQTGLLEDIFETLDDSGAGGGGGGGGLLGGGSDVGGLVPGFAGGAGAGALPRLLGGLASGASTLGPLAPFLAGPALGIGLGRTLFGDQDEELDQATETYTRETNELQERDDGELGGNIVPTDGGGGAVRVDQLIHFPVF